MASTKLESIKFHHRYRLVFELQHESVSMN